MTDSRGGTRRLVSGLGLLVTRTIGRWIPDPFVLAIGLTAITAILAVVIPGTFANRDPEGPSKVVLLVEAWWGDDGLWKLLKFGMQMILVLVTGYALAASPPVRRLIDRIAAGGLVWPIQQSPRCMTHAQLDAKLLARLQQPAHQLLHVLR